MLLYWKCVPGSCTKGWARNCLTDGPSVGGPRLGVVAAAHREEVAHLQGLEVVRRSGGAMSAGKNFRTGSSRLSFPSAIARSRRPWR